MNCEIEFLPVGDASKAGDAIVVRYGSPEAYELMIVDGGFADTGKEIVNHVRGQFGNDAWISHVVLTHADQDHAGGLRDVLTDLNVSNFWLHMPWDIDASTLAYFADKRWTVDGLQKKLIAEYDLLAELVGIALAKQITVLAPFTGAQIGPFQVLSPTQQVYRALMPQFDRTPEPDESVLKAAGAWLGKAQRPNMLGGFLEKAEAVLHKFFTESWTKERLKDGGQTSASNESSVVLYGFDNMKPVLLAGDAGVCALTMAADRADALRLPLQNFSCVQIPHHGSRRNVGPTILNRLLGPIQAEGLPTRFLAFVSAPKNDSTHPRQMVINAFLRRGGKVIATQGLSKVHWGGFPVRPGYSSAVAMPFVEQVEDYD
jgi:beta-lactamase superfamily II metal-dependent hydrolase